MTGGSHLTVGSAGDTDSRALYARMAVITGSIASGFPVISTATTASPAASTTSVVTTTDMSTDDTATADTRLSGVGLHLGAVEKHGAATHHDLFATLRSALDGFSAQTGFDELLVRQLIAA